MRVNPASAAYQQMLRRDRRTAGADTGRLPDAGHTALPAPVEPGVEQEHDAFLSYVHMNAAFLTQVVASQDADLVQGNSLPSDALYATSAYRAVAALPRKRPIGHVIVTDR